MTAFNLYSIRIALRGHQRFEWNVLNVLRKKLAGLTTTCGTVSTSASAKLLYCCGLSMTSSFFGALLALPCIINGSDKISPHKIPKRSGQPAFQMETKSWEKKFWEVFVGYVLTPATASLLRMLCPSDRSGYTPRLRRPPLLYSAVLPGGS